MVVFTPPLMASNHAVVADFGRTPKKPLSLLGPVGPSSDSQDIAEARLLLTLQQTRSVPVGKRLVADFMEDPANCERLMRAGFPKAQPSPTIKALAGEMKSRFELDMADIQAHPKVFETFMKVLDKVYPDLQALANESGHSSLSRSRGLAFGGYSHPSLLPLMAQNAVHFSASTGLDPDINIRIQEAAKTIAATAVVAGVTGAALNLLPVFDTMALTAITMHQCDDIAKKVYGVQDSAWTMGAFAQVTGFLLGPTLANKWTHVTGPAGSAAGAVANGASAATMHVAFGAAFTAWNEIQIGLGNDPGFPQSVNELVKMAQIPLSIFKTGEIWSRDSASQNTVANAIKQIVKNSTGGA